MVKKDDQNDDTKKTGRPVDRSAVYSEPTDLGEENVIASINPNVSVMAKPGESAESLLRRFRQKVKEAGLMDKLEEIRFYQKPSKRRQHEAKLRQQKISRAQKYEE